MNALQSILGLKKKRVNDDDSDSSNDNPLIDSSTNKVAIAVDLGTDGVAIAYAYNNQIHSHTQWEYSRMDQHTVKPKAQILLNQKGKKIAFGRDAQINYMTTDTDTSKRWMLFDRFKMHLYDPLDVFNTIDVENIDYVFDTEEDDEIEYKVNELNKELIAVNGLKYSSESVFIQVFKYIHKECKQYLKKHKINVSHHATEVILTVPSVWNETAKYKLATWAQKAGLFKNMDQCRIVYEADAASIFIQHKVYKQYLRLQKKLSRSHAPLCDDHTPTLAHVGNLSRLLQQDLDIIEDEKLDMEQIPKFDKTVQYIMIDAGGGTVDIACHEVVGEFGDEMGVKEVLPSTGGAWGSNYIDDQYKRLLMKIFSSKWINEYIQISPNGWSTVMDEFRVSKSKFYVHPQNTRHCVKIPLELISFLETTMEPNPDVKDLQQFVNKIRVDFKTSAKPESSGAKRCMLKLSDNILSMHIQLWKSMFNSVINPLIKHVEQLLESEHLNNVQYMCLVGGLSNSKYFQRRMDKAFGMNSMYRLGIIIPTTPKLATVLGAAYLSITRNYIRSRILNATYGIEIDKTLESAKTCNVSDHHIKENKYYNDNAKQYFVRNCFSIYAKKKQMIYSGQVIEKTYQRIPPNASKIKIKIFHSVIASPTVTTSARHLADLIIKFEEKEVEKVVVEFHFYDTLIRVYSYPKDRKDQKQEIKLHYALTELD